MRVCLFFVWEKPLSLLRRQGRVAAPSIRCALLASCWPLPQQRLPVSVTGGGRRCCPCRGEPLAGRAALSWTLEAQYGAKGRALLQRAAASGQCTLSSCRWPRQQGTTVHETDKLCSSRGNLTDMPRPPLDRGGGTASAVTERLISRYAFPIHRKGDDSRQHFRDPESVPDAGGAELAAEQPRQRHDEDDVPAEGDDQ